jgi:hypothetical protein
MMVVKEDELRFRQVMEKLLAQFADKMWITRTMIVKQEGVLFYFSVLNFVALSCWIDLAAADCPGHKSS